MQIRYEKVENSAGKALKPLLPEHGEISWKKLKTVSGILEYGFEWLNVKRN